MSISSGRLRQYVRIERDQKTPDGYGGFNLTPETFWEGEAFIERMASFRGDVERITAGAVGSHPIVRIHVRADEITETLPRLGAGMRIIDVDSGIRMNINFAQDMTGKSRTIMLTATENQPG